MFCELITVSLRRVVNEAKQGVNRARGNFLYKTSKLARTTMAGGLVKYTVGVVEWQGGV